MTLTKSGYFGYAGGGKNGAVVDAWLASRFVGAPAEDSSPPTGTADAGPVTTTIAFGGPGSYLLTMPTAADYYIRIQYGNHAYWSFCSAGSIGGQSGGGGAGALFAINNLSDLINAVTARANLGVPPVLVGTGDNGVTDNYASFVTQLTAFAASGYGTVVLPATTGYYGVSQDLTIPAGVTIKGQGTYLNKFPAQNGNHGTVQWGSAIGPYVNAAPTFTNGVVVLSNPGSGIESLTVIGINNTNGTTYGRAANSAVYVTGTGAKATSTAVRIRDCVLWGGLISVLDCETGSDDLAVFNTQINNSEFQGTNAVGASPAGCVVLVRSAADIRFQGVQTFSGSVQIGYNSGGSDFKWVGGHITGDGISGTATCPSVYLSSSTGGGFSGVTLDNGSANLLALIIRNKGTWAFNGCRFQTGSAYAYPLVKQNVDTANTSGTGDPYRGFMFSGCHVSGSGSFAGFTCLVNYTYITTAPATIPDVIDGLVIDPARLDASCGTTIGTRTVTNASIGTADNGKQVAGPGIPAHTYVGTVTNGVSFFLSSSPTSQVNVNATATGTVTLGIGNVVGAAAGSLTTPNFYQLQGVDSATLVPVTTDCIVYNGAAVTRTP